MNPAIKTGPRNQRADARRNRELVLESARTVFAERGLDAQIDEIARGAGVGVGTVYRHFPTKEDLLEALAQARFEGLAEQARVALEAEDGWDGFVDFMTYSARVMAEDRLLSEAMDQRPETCGRAATGVHLIDLVAELVDRAKATGKLRDRHHPLGRGRADLWHRSRGPLGSGHPGPELGESPRDHPRRTARPLSATKRIGLAGRCPSR